MPTGPKGEKRSADVIGNAVKVMRIATGEEADPLRIRFFTREIRSRRRIRGRSWLAAEDGASCRDHRRSQYTPSTDRGRCCPPLNETFSVWAASARAEFRSLPPSSNWTRSSSLFSAPIRTLVWLWMRLMDLVDGDRAEGRFRGLSQQLFDFGRRAVLIQRAGDRQPLLQ